MVRFRETGLVPGGTATLMASATANAVFTCAGGAGSAAGPDLPVITSVSSLRRVRAGADGAVEGAITISPPPPAQAPCGEGASGRLRGVQYTGVTVSDVTNAVRIAVPFG